MAGLKEGIVWSLYGLGLLHFKEGDAVTARSLFEESLALYRALRQRRSISYPLYQLGRVAARPENLPSAHFFFKERPALFPFLEHHPHNSTSFTVFATLRP